MKAWTVARLDMAVLFKSRDYWLPMSMLAGVFFVVVPLFMLSVVTSNTSSELAQQLGNVINTLPDTVQDQIQGDTPQTQAAFGFAVYLLAPIAIVVPLTISSAVAANALVSDREKGTGEFLAHSPLTERDIYLGKLIASLVPGYVATVVGFGIYSVIVNTQVGPQLGGWFFPTAGWWLLIFWVVPPFIAFAISVIVMVSGRVRSAAAAQQTATLVTLPVIVLAYAIASGLLYDPVVSALTVGVVAWLAAAVTLGWGARSLHRARLLGVGRDA